MIIELVEVGIGLGVIYIIHKRNEKNLDRTFKPLEDAGVIPL
jgi:hypothetical protein